VARIKTAIWARIAGQTLFSAIDCTVCNSSPAETAKANAQETVMSGENHNELWMK